MNDRENSQRPVQSMRAPAIRRGWWVFGGFAAIALVLFGLEHRAHVLGWLPWLFLLACPLMHLFMHGGHGAQGAHGRDAHQSDEK